MGLKRILIWNLVTRIINVEDAESRRGKGEGEDEDYTRLIQGGREEDRALR